MPSSSSAPQKQHPLKSQWFVTYFPYVDKSKEAAKEYEEIQDQKEVDNISTIEELWSMFDSLPHPTTWPASDSLALTRDRLAPFYETFPEGVRISIFTKTKVQSELALKLIFASIMGETLTEMSNNEPVADVIRISHKPGKLAPESMRLEVWLRNDKYLGAIETHFRTEMQRDYPQTIVNSAHMHGKK